MNVSEIQDYQTIFSALPCGATFKYRNEIYLKTQPILMSKDRETFIRNAVKTKYGDHAYIEDKEPVVCYPNARVAIYGY